MPIWLHSLSAVAALALGLSNLALAKGTPRHRIVGWAWIALMLCVALSSFWIRDLNPGAFSWLHGLTAWTLASMLIAIVAIRRGQARIHAGFMIGTIAGALIAGAFALAPGRFIADLVGY